MAEESRKVLVVDDSAFMRKALSDMISSDPELKVIDTARDGIDAIEKVQKLKKYISRIEELPRQGTPGYRMPEENI